MDKTVKGWALGAITVLAVALGTLAHSADTSALTGSDGSNMNGAERVCGNGSAATFAEAYANCRRGDIIGLGRALPFGIMQVCDFSKTILYVKGEPMACVYIGSLRQQVK